MRVVKLSLQVVGLSLRARSAGASGDRRGTDKNNRVLSRNVTKERVLSCGTLVSRNEPEGTERKSASARRINVRSPRQGRKRKEPLAARA